jgi:pyruvate dehydrogenase E2 component (dihydrolipoamide acetyltransferase)
VNASLRDGRIRLHPQINIGVAVGGDDGLVVPVIRRAEQKSLEEIDSELKRFENMAATMRFSPEELSGGTFTISNLGMFGIDRFNAIVNPPESAILAVGRIVRRPVGLPDDTIVLRPMMSLTLTVDHRVLDGVQAAQFLVVLKELIETPPLLDQREDER